MKRYVIFACAAIVPAILVAPADPAGAPKPKDPPQRKVQFARDILPILSANCFLCHGPDAGNRKAGLRLDIPEMATKTLKSGNTAIVPGDVEESELIARILADGKERMPPPASQKHLKAAEKELLKRWIAEGAEYQRHWAFVPPSRPALPSPKNKIWARNPIDLFVLARLEAEGMQAAPDADRYTLARRVAIDLTGLPPTMEAVDRFINDKSAEAYEKFVDQILASPSYGERWAQVWLDLARYADSNGFATDNPRTIWRYRDWVIEAINKNMPFDQFTIEQIAGDMLPNATLDQIVATAFHRNTLTNDEGGTDDEEWRVAAVVDRVNTTMQVWMGITIGCAQCHDHKYDPITQEEYYRMFAIFNQTEDSDKPDNRPTIASPDPVGEKRKAELLGKIAVLEKELNRPSPELDATQERWEKEIKQDKLPPNIKTILALERAKRNDAQKAELTKYYRSIAPELKKPRDEIAALKKQLGGLPSVMTPIMRELPEKQRRKTHIHIRGNFLDKGKEVAPGMPVVFHRLPDKLPANRLAVARWLVDPQNPLTARVTVNRYWEQIFGVGLVETPEDWGIRSKLPNHPDLLDWLATEFSSPLPRYSGGEGLGVRGWDVKRLLRLIVTSSTYRQSSRVTPEELEKDAHNRLFGRGARFRSSAEAIRDQTLYVSGLLSPRLYGEPVRPPRPKLGLTAAFGGSTDWQDSTGSDKHRRALYTFIRRSAPYPSMSTFDAPDRNVCTVKRPRTNTPLQALVTLNDPCFVEAAQALARRILKDGGPSVESKVQHGFRLCLTRPPRDAEAKRLAELFDKARKVYAGKPKEAMEFATDPLGPLPAGVDAADAAAWTVVANVMLNLDEMFSKR